MIRAVLRHFPVGTAALGLAGYWYLYSHQLVDRPIRADGRKVHDVFLYEVKKPAESKGAWDYYKLRSTIPAAQAFRPIDQGECSLVKK